MRPKPNAGRGCSVMTSVQIPRLFSPASLRSDIFSQPVKLFKSAFRAAERWRLKGHELHEVQSEPQIMIGDTAAPG